MTTKQRWLTCWVPHRLEMLLSPSWQCAPRPLKRAIERLEIEHLRHGGQNNGELFVSFRQFVDYGISRRSIAPVLKLGEDLGLLEIIRPNDSLSDIRSPHAYRLSYLPAKGHKAPTDEWKTVSRDRVDALLSRFKTSEAVAAKATRKEAA